MLLVERFSFFGLTFERSHRLPRARMDFRVEVVAFIQVSNSDGQAVDLPRLVRFDSIRGTIVT